MLLTYFRMASVVPIYFLVTTGFALSLHKFRGCLPDERRCPNNGCISSSWFCDGVDDCGDNFDEQNCTVDKGCYDDERRCPNNGCISSSWFCDGVDDCGDNFDEQNCTVDSCSEDERRCPNGICINNSSFCDGNNDCGDNFDEKNCSCPDDKRRCPNGRCIPIAWFCDDQDDCGDDFDEENCTTSCADNKYRCPNGKCIPSAWFCDGMDDCRDNFDEENCTTSCPADKRRCPNGRCILSFWFCDGKDDCGDNFDEEHCSTNYDYCILQFRFPCLNGICIPRRWLCDGTDNCGDNSDENDCISGIRSIDGLLTVERKLTEQLLSTRQQQTRSIYKWGPHITMIAVALYLNDESFFAPGNKTGDEITYELSFQLFSKLILKKQISTTDLALYINALTVACIDPKDFFGANLVDELRKRVNSSKTNPFALLTLCNANDTMTTDDVLKLQMEYDAHFLPLWTDTQAMIVMALSCITSRTDVYQDEKILDEMVSELKRNQQKNGTDDNLRTTALITQALLAVDDYRTDFDLTATINFIMQEVTRNHINIDDIYYILPIFNSMSLANINSDHCESHAVTGPVDIKVNNTHETILWYRSKPSPSTEEVSSDVTETPELDRTLSPEDFTALNLN